MNTESTIVYTKTDEAPALATRAFLPLVRSFTSGSGIHIEEKDISLAGRILSRFPEYLREEQRQSDALKELGSLVLQNDANIIKLPNISASLRQLYLAIEELQSKGFSVPDYPSDPKNEEEKEIRRRYDAIKGSAVNPVLRMGNSDRRAPKAVKNFARKKPHSMAAWSPDSRAEVSAMERGDFYGSEKSHICDKAETVHFYLDSEKGDRIQLRKPLQLEKGEIIDAAVMDVQELRSFLRKEIEDARKKDLLFSVHLKATMMKVSDPIIFGHVVSVFFEELFEKHGEILETTLAYTPDNGLSDLYGKLEQLPEHEAREIQSTIEEIYAERPELAMINSDKGITSLHVSSDLIIDASMPAAIRAGGKMWAPDGSMKAMKALIPDRSYAGIYRETVEECKRNGAFDPTTMGSVSNVGLMAQKAEEYGSHDKTFCIPETGIVRITTEGGDILLEQAVQKGDIFRACQVKDAPVRDWVRLGVERARSSQSPAIFWLDKNRAHDAALIQKVERYLKEEDTRDLDLRILSPEEAIRSSFQLIRRGEDCISITGNVLRDYLTDLFPIMELGTSAKMLSIVPLMNGGKLFETGAGGSAPKHVQQFIEEGHLRWDSLGEYLALTVSLEELGKRGNQRAALLAKTLDKAVERLLEEGKGPSRKCGEIDNRGSHFYLSLFWAEELSKQRKLPEMATAFTNLAKDLEAQEELIVRELLEAQGEPQDIGGYYLPDEEKADSAMRPCVLFNTLLEQFAY